MFRPPNRGCVVEKRPVAAKMANQSSRPAQNQCSDPKCRLEAGREFQRCKLERFRDLRGTQNAKVVYPPPLKRANSRGLKLTSRNEVHEPAKTNGFEADASKMGQNRPKNGPKCGQQREKWGMAAPKSPPKSPFWASSRWGGARGHFVVRARVPWV